MAKTKFVAEHFPGLFDDIRFTSSDGEKIDVIRKYAESHADGSAMSQCVLVEDTLSTLWTAHADGIKCVHVTNILTGNLPDF